MLVEMKSSTVLRSSLSLALSLLPLARSEAAPLNYSDRTKSYSGWNSGLRGDSQVIGTGGGAFAMPESISASDANPASFGFSLDTVEAQINKYRIQDRSLNRAGDVSEESQGGLGVAVPPWGFGFSYFTPYSEIGSYATPVSNGVPVHMKVSLTEYHLTLSRILIKDRLSAGLSVEAVKANYEIGSNDSTSSTKVLPRVGVLYSTPDRIFLGASFRPGAVIHSDQSIGSQYVGGFAAPIQIPSLLNLGVGWLPNRYFRAGFDLMVPFGREGAALLADQNVQVGNHTTYQPHLGASYVLLEYQNFKVEFSAGTYLQVSRMDDTNNRFHKTAAVDINPWFINTSFGFDTAPQYRNVVASIGIDIVRTARFLGIIPKDSVPPLNGIAPAPLKESAVGLPGGMTVEQPKGTVKGPDIKDVSKIIEDIPARVSEKFTGKKKLTKEEDAKSKTISPLRKRNSKKKPKFLTKEPLPNATPAPEKAPEPKAEKAPEATAPKPTN